MKSKSRSTAFAQASLAKIYLSPEPEPGFEGKIPGYSTNLFESCGLLDPCIFSSKTLPPYLGAVSTLSSQKYPPAGMMRNGQIYLRKPVGRLIDATAGGAFAKGAVPTPTVTGNYNRRGLSKKSGDGLATWVKKQAQLPQGAEINPRALAKIGRLLNEGKFPTPTAWDVREKPSLPSQLRRDSPALQTLLALTEQAGGSLNPTWVEWLMGFPPGWTA